jgi:hypothetical protein
MWVNPNHPSPPRQADPPEERGRRLATIPRGDDVELRVSLDSYRGHPYLSLRLWGQDVLSGEWWPLKGRGLSIRVGELEQVVDALESARRTLARLESEQRDGRRPPFGPPASRGSVGAFDEFDSP